MVFAIASILLTLTAPAHQATTVDATGRWEGTLAGQRPDGGTDEGPALIILTQKETVLTGTVGADDSDRHPITKGTIEGNKLTLFATSGDGNREFKIELTIEKDEMKGTISAGERLGNLLLRKVKL